MRSKAAGTPLERPLLKVSTCSHAAAAFACRNWHYSASMPAGKLARLGVWEDMRFCGVVLFGRGACPAAGKQFGLEQLEICELVRVAMDTHLTPVSRVVAVAVRLLRRRCPRLRLIVSYADPEQGHHGGIYQAMGWQYVGLSTPQVSFMLYGKRIHKRSGNSMMGKKHTLPRATIPEQRHKYLLPLDDEMRERVAALALPYPKQEPPC